MPSLRHCRFIAVVLGLSPAALIADAPPVVDPGAPGGVPSDAIVLFDGTDLSEFHGPGGKPSGWKVEGGIATIVPGTGALTTKRSFGDIQLHLEWRAPRDDSKTGESRGNSGIKFHGAYEIQILDSYGQESKKPRGQAGAIYNQFPPYVNASRKPLEWQTYDIIFRSPYFDDAGRVVKNGTFTILHNGVLIQERERVLGRTNSNVPGKPDYKQPFFLQDHGSPVSFRNIWVRELPRRPLRQTQRGAVRRRVLAADYSRDRKRLFLVNGDGDVLFKFRINNIHDAQVLPNGNILFQTDWTKIVEADSRGNVVWEYDAGKRNGNAGKRVEVHAIQRLDNGLTMIVESGSARIIEVDREGKIHKNVALRVDQPDAHRDTRNARKIAGGHYLVAHEKDGKVREYDGGGRVVWEYDVGGPVYSAVRLANGNTLIGGGGTHEVREVDRQGDVVWKIAQNDLKGVRLGWITQVARLKNGNTIVVNCHAGRDNPQIVEVDRQKNVVWSFHDFTLFGNNLAMAQVLDVDIEAR